MPHHPKQKYLKNQMNLRYQKYHFLKYLMNHLYLKSLMSLKYLMYRFLKYQMNLMFLKNH